jgi:hypothetical protein
MGVFPFQGKKSSDHQATRLAGPKVVQKKKTPSPTGIPTELSRLLKRRNLYKTVVVKSGRMSQIEHNIKTDLRV